MYQVWYALNWFCSICREFKNVHMLLDGKQRMNMDCDIGVINIFVSQNIVIIHWLETFNDVHYPLLLLQILELYPTD